MQSGTEWSGMQWIEMRAMRPIGMEGSIEQDWSALNSHSSVSIECISWAFAGHLLQSIDPICSKRLAPSQALVSPAVPCQSRCMRCLPLQDTEVDWLEEKFSGIGAAAPPTPDVSAETWLRLQVVSLGAMDAPMGVGMQCQQASLSAMPCRTLKQPSSTVPCALTSSHSSSACSSVVLVCSRPCFRSHLCLNLDFGCFNTGCQQAGACGSGRLLGE